MTDNAVKNAYSTTFEELVNIHGQIHKIMNLHEKRRGEGYNVNLIKCQAVVKNINKSMELVNNALAQFDIRNDSDDDAREIIQTASPCTAHYFKDSSCIHCGFDAQ